MVAQLESNCCVECAKQERKTGVEKESSLLELDNFNAALRQVLSVPKTELKRLLEEEKAAKAGEPKPGPRPSASAHDSDASD
jgi:hypothetical protein